MIGWMLAVTGGGTTTAAGLAACAVIFAVVVALRVRNGRWPKGGKAQIGPFREDRDGEGT